MKYPTDSIWYNYLLLFLALSPVWFALWIMGTLAYHARFNPQQRETLIFKCYEIDTVLHKGYTSKTVVCRDHKSGKSIVRVPKE